MQLQLDTNKLKDHLKSAISWLTGPGCCYENTPVGKLGKTMNYANWLGAIKGEYSAATKEWSVACPYWHTGQAVKALVFASEVLENKEELLEAAKFSAQFLLSNQRSNGLFPAIECTENEINTSATLETVDGLFYLSSATKEPKYQEAALAALEWVSKNAWMKDKKLFRDIYIESLNQFIYNTNSAQDRPLLDDAVFVKAYHLTGNIEYLNIALDTATTLIENENPPGNWIKYIPCNKTRGNIHPRHAFWWGLPMLTLYHETKDVRYKDVFYRSVAWYEKALRVDGGLFRMTFENFNTPSFGHATSGSACAARCFIAAYLDSKEEKYLKLAEKAISFCCSMQLLNCKDPNLQGVILEKVLPPDGTDNLPYYVRDLGTIFFIQAACEYLQLAKNN